MGIDTGDWEHMWMLSVSLLVTVALGAAVAYFAQDLQTNWRGIVRGVRGSALRWPLHPWQLGAAFVVFINTLAFYGVVFKALTNNYSTFAPAGGGVIWDIIGVLHVAAAVAFWFLLAYLELYDPSAEGLTQEEVDEQRVDKANKNEKSALLETDLRRTTSKPTAKHWTAAHPWCFCADKKGKGGYKRCNKFYAGRFRYHCRSCNRCTTGFDHHCRYLNQCISTANYQPWICFIIALNVQSLTQAIVSISCIVAASDDDIHAELKKWGLGTLITLSVVCLIIEVVATAFTCQLMWIHFELMRLQLMTGKFVTTRSWWGNKFDDGKDAEEIEMAIWQLFRAQDERRQQRREEAAAAAEEAAAAGEEVDVSELVRAPSSTGFEEIRKSRHTTEAYKGKLGEERYKDKYDETYSGSGRVFGKAVVDPQSVVKRWIINMKHNMNIDDLKRVQSERDDLKKTSLMGFGWFTRLFLGDDSIDEDLYDNKEAPHKEDETDKGSALTSVATSD